MKVTLGQILVAAAIGVSLPRHLVAANHAAGLAVPTGAVWAATVGASALAWTALEGGTFFHLWRAYAANPQRRLLALMAVILLMIAGTNAPSLVADSAGMSLVQLTGVATVGHVAWAVAGTASTLLVVLAAGAADAALSKSQPERQRIDSMQAALTDAIDSLRQAAADVRQTGSNPIQTQTAQLVTVNVAPSTPPIAQGGASERADAPIQVGSPADRDMAVFQAMRGGHVTLPAIAEATGMSVGQVRRTAQWQTRNNR